MECLNATAMSASPYDRLFGAASLIPISHYLLWVLLIFLVFMYNFLEFHLLEDLVTGFRGNPVTLTFSSCSEIYEGVVSKCRILHGRYLPTLWLSSPHLQTTFLNFFGRPPGFRYKRQLFHLPDGGTIALDWLKNSDVLGGRFHVNNNDTTPIVVVIPGLTSDSTSAEDGMLLLATIEDWVAFRSSDCFYNAGWTEDIRKVIDYLHHEYPEAPLFAVGTSIGANILVKYLGEDGDNTPVAGAAAVSSPWDLLVHFRRLAQKFYDRALTIGLQGYAKLHQPIYSRLADWEGIKKSRSIRDFDNYATCLVGKFETVDTYYRRCSSSGFVGNVSVPLLCINALDDPVCTREAIPWDECRANENIVLATTKHGGHLAFFEGITAECLWWVGAVNEFLGVLNSSPFIHRQKKMESSGPLRSLESSIDQGPFLNVTEDGMVAAMSNEQTANDIVEDISDEQMIQEKTMGDIGSNAEHSENKIKGEKDLMNDGIYPSKRVTQSNQDINHQDVTAPFRRCIDQLSRHNRRSLWLLAYIAIVTTWPLVGSTIPSVFRRKLKNFSPARLLRGR